MLFTLAMRYGVLLLGLGFGGMAVSSWQAGSPPAWSFAAARAETVVHASTIKVVLIANGTHRHHPIVQVNWPPGSNSLQELASLRSVFSAYRRDEAEAVVAAYPPGRMVTVRVVDGLPHADRHDRFQLLHALFMSVMSLIVTALGALFFVIFRDDQSATASTTTPPVAPRTTRASLSPSRPASTTQSPNPSPQQSPTATSHPSPPEEPAP